MKKLAIVGVFLALTGCAEVENYNDVVKNASASRSGRILAVKKVRNAVW
ncbi:FIG00640199: hypothetical protein [Citrobacter freundii]|uniref:Lipoprotein n=1 Tax=Citrobacter freundii TaxID=546 RepID=A0A7G2INX4_CITFR|nr:FIG00640199: hypothetical protein [Citrobacter freundii]